MLDAIEKLLPGIFQMNNIHPVVVHLPIALLSGFVVMEVAALVFNRGHLKVAADWMLYLGTLGAGAAVYAGLQAAEKVAHGGEVHALIERHQSLGLTVLGLGVMLSLWRLINSGQFTKLGQVIHLMLAFVMVGFLTLGADLGGMMVYKHGLAVNPKPPIVVASTNANGPAHNHKHDHGHSSAGIGHEVLDWIATLVGQDNHPIRRHNH